jgi:shikimate kinase
MALTFVGYRGTGKSTVARQIATRVGWRWVDADAVIEERAGCSIRRIFAEQGEPAFRALEQTVLAELLAEDELVIAAGGGAVLDPQTQDAMRRSGPVIWLTASIETILRRLAEDGSTRERRPSLTELDLQTEVDRLLAVREPLYREVSTFSVATDGRTPADIADEIVARLPELKGGR